MKITTIMLILFHLSDAAWFLKVIPTRSMITSYNKKYLVNPTTYIKRYGRNSEYYAFLEGTLLVGFGNNATLHLVFNEFLHNEYKRSFIEFKDRGCDFLNKNEVIGSVLKKYAPACPIPPSHLKYENATFSIDNFPNIFPFKKGRVDAYLTVTGTDENIGTGYIELEFEQNEKTPTKMKNDNHRKRG